MTPIRINKEKIKKKIDMLFAKIDFIDWKNIKNLIIFSFNYIEN